MPVQPLQDVGASSRRLGKAHWGKHMTKRRDTATAAVIALVLSAPITVGSYPVRADDLADLRANQELLQRRLDQLAQQNVGAGDYMAPTAGGPSTMRMMGGSFPRSFLIP